MPPLERTIITAVETQLQAHGVFYSNQHGSTMTTRNGMPDIITCDPRGRLAGIEVKRPGGKVYVNQYRQLVAILKSGGRAFVATAGFVYLQPTETVPVDLGSPLVEFELADQLTPLAHGLRELVPAGKE